jgi:ArsR family transcriptional regulator
MSNENRIQHDIETLYKLAELFKIFGDSTRIRILDTLTKKELCVQEIADELSMTQSAISHQLRILKQADLVRSRRDGKAIFYSLADGHVQTIMEQGIEHVCE